MKKTILLSLSALSVGLINARGSMSGDLLSRIRGESSEPVKQVQDLFEAYELYRLGGRLTKADKAELRSAVQAIRSNPKFTQMVKNAPHGHVAAYALANDVVEYVQDRLDRGARKKAANRRLERAFANELGDEVEVEAALY